MVVLAGGERLLVVPGLSVQRGSSRASVVTGQDVNLSVVIHLQLPVLRVVAQLLSKYFSYHHITLNNHLKPTFNTKSWSLLTRSDQCDRWASSFSWSVTSSVFRHLILVTSVSSCLI